MGGPLVSALLDRWSESLIDFALCDETVTTTDLVAVEAAYRLTQLARLARWFRL